MAGTTRDAAMIERLWWRAGFGPRPRDLRGKRTHADLAASVGQPRLNTFCREISDKQLDMGAR